MTRGGRGDVDRGSGLRAPGGTESRPGCKAQKHGDGDGSGGPSEGEEVQFYSWLSA